MTRTTTSPESVADDHDTFDVLRAMRTQEETSYQVPEFYTREFLNVPFDKKLPDYLAWRCDLVVKLIDVAGACGIDTETVEAALSIANRFATIDMDIMIDFDLCQLAYFVSLFIASKMQHRKLLKLKRLKTLCNGYFTNEEFECMEIHILYSLKWRVSPPTAHFFARNLLDLVPRELIPDKEIIEENIMAQVEISMVDERFLHYRVSLIAYAALINSLEPLLKKVPLDVIRLCSEAALGYEDHVLSDLEHVKVMLKRASGVGLGQPSVGKQSRPKVFRSNSELGSQLVTTPNSSPRSIVITRETFKNETYAMANP